MEMSEQDKAFVRQEVNKIVKALEKLAKEVKDSSRKPPYGMGPR